MYPLRLKPTTGDQGTESSLQVVLLPIARLLVMRGSGVDELVRAVKRAYLRAAVEAVLPTGRRVNISRLSVATGMTRKEVSTLLRDTQDERDVAVQTRGEQRALRVLRGWLTDPRFQNRSGRADALPYRGRIKSFALLVRLYGGDVTPKSVQRELERLDLIQATRAGTLRLRATRERSGIAASQLSDLARRFEDFALAVMKPKTTADPPRFFGFKDSTVPAASDAAFFMSRFSRRAAALLEDFEEWSVGRESTSSASQENTAVRVGLGVYLLRSEPSLAPGVATYAGVRAGGRRPRKPT